MDFGPHTEHVEEVIATVMRGSVLRPGTQVEAPGALVITDLEEARQYAWYRPIAGDESPTWTDLRQEQSAPFHAVPYERPELKPAYDAVQALLEPMCRALEQSLPPQYVTLLDDLGGDLQHCAMNRTLYGLVEDSVWERMWQVYRQGAWPCGWDGDYPAGRMIIFQPPIA